MPRLFAQISSPAIRRKKKGTASAMGSSTTASERVRSRPRKGPAAEDACRPVRVEVGADRGGHVRPGEALRGDASAAVLVPHAERDLGVRLVSVLHVLELDRADLVFDP